MPNYDYECQDCNYVFEVFQQMTDERLTECPKCKGHVERLIGGGAGIIFKGSGFYVNDYKKASKATGKGTTKTDVKSNTKSSTTTKAKATATS